MDAARRSEPAARQAALPVAEPAVEAHPLEPFLPFGAETLFLGSFPPPRQRWSMDFFYPNFTNDFWRIMGLLHFSNPHYFELAPLQSVATLPSSHYPLPSLSVQSSPCGSESRKRSAKGFDRERIIAFCEREGLAFFDTAVQVRRLKGNASDAFLEVVEPTDVGALLERMPRCHRLATTGGKAAEELHAILLRAIDSASAPTAGPYELVAPPIGECVTVRAFGRDLEWWRMPSSSRAYPLPLARKAAQYAKLFK